MLSEDCYVICYNQAMEKVGVIDSYESLIWTERYNEAGEFELYFPFNVITLAKVLPDYYIRLPAYSDKTMIVEDIVIGHDSDKGNYCTITGRSVESLLDRRVYCVAKYEDSETTSYTDDETYVMIAIEALIESGFSEEDETKRYVPFIEAPHWDGYSIKDEDDIDEQIDELEIIDYNWSSISNGNVYDEINTILNSTGIGIRALWNGSPLAGYADGNSGLFVYNLYIGNDRTSDADDKNMYLLLSESNDNLSNTETCIKNSEYKNVVIVYGYDGPDQVAGTTSGGMTTVIDGLVTAKAWSTIVEPTGLNRRETFVDVTSSLPPEEDSDGNPILSNAYWYKLKQYGATYIRNTDYMRTTAVSGIIDYRQVGLSIGDRIEVVDNYGDKTKKQVTELSYTIDTSGISLSVNLSNSGVHTAGYYPIMRMTSTRLNNLFTITSDTYGLVALRGNVDNASALAAFGNMPVKVYSYISNSTTYYALTGDTTNYNVDTTGNTYFIAKKKVKIKITPNLFYTDGKNEWSMVFNRTESNPNKVIIYNNGISLATYSANDYYGLDADTVSKNNYSTELSLDIGDVMQIQSICNNNASNQYILLPGMSVALYF